jgi:hydrogenase nickel incorporation protein HypB
LCELCGCAAATDHVHVAGTPLPAASGWRVEVMQSLLRDNDHQAAHNRSHFAAAGTLVVNLMSSPGAGKTSLLEATIRALDGRLAVAVIEGDLETENDARRIRALGAPAVQITTGNACHLDAAMVHAALHRLDLRPIDVLFIENVGNLVCPAGFDLGQHCNVVLLSVTEGDDKPEKYPVMFRAADLLAVTKTDLLAAVGDFVPARAIRHLRALASAAPVLELSARSGAGMAHWIDWLVEQRAGVPTGTVTHGHAAHGHAAHG